jgi:hypothetical protein
MAKTKMICITGKNALHKLNESAGAGRYILEGVFAELDKLNRNSRIYTKEEYLKHLQYLRDDIRKGEPLLGELDHPEDRFEVKLKEASHRIIDIWYDQAKNVVMGKIELLNTPNGKLAQSIVDQGIPLHISSRAAGTVNSDNTVSIQQIYTYDLVCKPGFAGAVLHRVNESVDSNNYGKDVMGFLQKSEIVESQNTAKDFGFLTESVSIKSVDSDVNLRKEAIDIINENDKLKDIMKKTYKKLNEEDDFDSIFGTADSGENGDEKDTKKDSEGGDENDDKEDGDDKGVEILSITPEYGGSSDEDSSDEKKDENPEENNDEDNTDECDRNKEADPKDALNDTKKDTEEMTSGQKTVIDKLDQILKAAKGGSKKQDECSGGQCESLIMAQYPISMSLNESNFTQFAALNEEQKTKVVAYLQDHGIFAPKMINEMWKNGIDYNTEEPVWLKYAPANYKALYNEAPQAVKESLKNTANYLLFESQRDINVFWENSGLEAKAENHRRNVEFTNSLPKINESAAPKNSGLPYGMNLINAVVEMANEYN